jgi:putative addiction module killer protein
VIEQRHVRVFRSKTFERWMKALRDKRAIMAIERRIDRLADGNVGDSRSVGGKVIELRIDEGPGYRVYFTRIGDAIVVLLCGGDKSTQSRDIEAAKAAVSKAEDIIRGAE